MRERDGQRERERSERVRERKRKRETESKKEREIERSLERTLHFLRRQNVSLRAHGMLSFNRFFLTIYFIE